MCAKRAGPRPTVNFVSPLGANRDEPGLARRALPGLGFLLAAALLLASHVGPALAEADAPDAGGGGAALTRLLAEFAAMPGLTAHFREEKHMALLAAPLTSRGEIAFAPPGRLRRQVTEPVESLMLVRDGEMLLRDPYGSRVIDLSSQPMVRVFVDGITLLLAGDLEGLRARYRMRFAAGDVGPSDAWSLELEPTVAPLDEVIASIRFAGRGRVLDTLTVVETSGDETRTRFSEVDAEKHFSSEEIRRLFGAPESLREERTGRAPGR